MAQGVDRFQGRYFHARAVKESHYLGANSEGIRAS